MPSVFACCRKRKHFFGRIKIHKFQTEDKSEFFHYESLILSMNYDHVSCNHGFKGNTSKINGGVKSYTAGNDKEIFYPALESKLITSHATNCDGRFFHFRTV